MKKNILLLVFGCFTIIGFSQDILYGIRAGVNVSNLDFKPDPTFSNQHRNGFVFGGFVDYGITEKFSVLLELQYSAEGANADALKADYIQMPILARFGFGDKLKLGVGPMASLKTWENKDTFSTFTYALVGGVEYMITDELFIDSRVHYGLSDILDDDTTTIEATNMTFQFGIGLKI